MEMAQPDSRTCRFRNTLLGAIRTHLAAIAQFHWGTALAENPDLIDPLITDACNSNAPMTRTNRLATSSSFVCLRLEGRVC
jgi:hypothetical protein